MAAIPLSTVSPLKNLYVCVAAMVLGAGIGYLMRPKQMRMDPDVAAVTNRIQGKSMSDDGQPLMLWQEAFAACNSGRLEGMLASLTKMGCGAEELFKPWIKRAVKVALIDGRQQPANIYADLTMNGNLGTVSAGLEVIGELRPENGPQLMQILNSGGPGNPLKPLMMKSLFKGWARGNREQAALALNGLTSREQYCAAQGLLAGLAEGGRSNAIQKALAGLPGLKANVALQSLFADWYGVQPEEAIQGITPEIAARSPQAAALLIEHRLRNGSKLDELKAQAARADSSVTWAGLVEFAAEKAATTLGTEAALALLREPEAMSQPGHDSAMRVLAFKTPRGADKALEEVPLGPNRDGMMRGVMRNMAVHEPEAAVAFLARENSERPSPAIQQSYGDFFKAWLNADPSAALEGIEKIQDPTVQANLQTILHQRESDVDWNLVDAVKAEAAAPAVGQLAPGTVSSGQ